MFKRIVSFIGLIGFITGVSVLWTHSAGSLLLKASLWAFIAAITVGTAAGLLGARKIRAHRLKEPERHTVGSIFQHWGTAVSIFILIVSGFQIRLHGGFSSTNLHFLGLFLTLLFGSYFITDFFASRKYEALLPDVKDIFDGTIKKYLLNVAHKETGKYQSSQKSAFLAFIILGGQIMISGAVKLLPFYTRIPAPVVETATLVHDVSAFLFVLILIVHVFLVIAVRVHRPLLGSWFTGKHPKVHDTQPAEPVNVPPVQINEVIPQTVNQNRINISLPEKSSQTALLPDTSAVESEPVISPEGEIEAVSDHTGETILPDTDDPADGDGQPEIADRFEDQIEKVSLSLSEIDEVFPGAMDKDDIDNIVPNACIDQPEDNDWPLKQESNIH